MRTCDPQRIKGWWFLPSTPDDRVPGTLTWSQSDGASLELIGGLATDPELSSDRDTPVHTHVFPKVKEPTTIFGETSAGKAVTIWAAERGTVRSAFGTKTLEEFWHSSQVMVGAHLHSLDSPNFRSITVSLDDLYYLTTDGRFCPPQWAKIEGVERPGEELDNGTLLTPFILPVVGGMRAEVATANTPDTTYQIDTYATRPWASDATEATPGLKLDMMTNRTRSGPRIELRVTSSAVVAVRHNEVASASDLVRRLAPLWDLVSLATIAQCGVESIQAKTADGDRVSFLWRFRGQSQPHEQTGASGTVFTLEDVPLQQFLRVRESLTSSQQALYAWNVVTGLVDHSPLMVEEHVSQVLAAAEGLHRWCLGGSPDDLLKDRLVALHGRLPDTVKDRLQLDTEKWAGWAAWARNHVDHGGAKKHREVDDFLQLKVLSDSVLLVICLVVFRELKVPVDKVEEAMINHPRISVLTKRCADVASMPEL